MKAKHTLSDAKRALRLFRSEWASKDLQRQNALKWLAATRALGEKWVLSNGPAKWGHGRSEA